MKEEDKKDDAVKDDDLDDPAGDDGGDSTDSRTYTAAEYRKIKDEAASRRKQLRDTQAELATLKESLAKNEGLLKRLSSLFSGEGEEDPEKAMQTKAAEVEKQLEKAKSALMKAELISALSSAGVSRIEDAVAVALYRGELSKCEVDLEAGKVTGLDDVVEGLKKNRADFFEPPQRPRQTAATQVNSSDGSGGGSGGSYAEIIAKMSDGQREAASRMAKKNGWSEDFALKRAAYLHSLSTPTPLPEPRPEKNDQAA